MKRLWIEFRRGFVPCAILLTIGFGLGRLYTIDSIALDCKTMGSFRFANAVFQCKTTGIK